MRGTTPTSWTVSRRPLTTAENTLAATGQLAQFSKRWSSWIIFPGELEEGRALLWRLPHVNRSTKLWEHIQNGPAGVNHA